MSLASSALLGVLSAQLAVSSDLEAKEEGRRNLQHDCTEMYEDQMGLIFQAMPSASRT